MLTYKFVPDDVASECSQCVHELCFIHGLRLHETCGFLIVLFLRALSGCALPASDVLCPRAENSSRTVWLDRRDQSSHPLIIEARTGLADDGRVESANDSIAFKSVGFDYRVNV